MPENTIKIGSTVAISNPIKSKGGFAGRKGKVMGLNPLSRPADDGGLWFVQLDATDRASSCTQMFWGEELEAIDEAL